MLENERNMKIGLPRFTWGEKPPEETPSIPDNKRLHEEAWIVMKARTGELSDLDMEYVSEHLSEMLENLDLQEKWSHVNFGRTTFQYRVDLKNIAAMWKQNHPN